MEIEFEFDGEIWYWRGPAPWYYVTMPEMDSLDLKAISNEVTYGWGVIPVQAQIGKTIWKTSLFPKEGRYLVPLKASVRSAEGIDEGDNVHIRLTVKML